MNKTKISWDAAKSALLAAAATVTEEGYLVDVDAMHGGTVGFKMRHSDELYCLVRASHNEEVEAEGNFIWLIPHSLDGKVRLELYRCAPLPVSIKESGEPTAKVYRCAVPGYDTNGDEDFWFVKVQVPLGYEDFDEDGVQSHHWQAARLAAANNDLDVGDMCPVYDDAMSRWDNLLSIFDWDTASVVDLHGQEILDVPDIYRYRSLDEVAECVSGITKETHAELWQLLVDSEKEGTDKPLGGDGSDGTTEEPIVSDGEYGSDLVAGWPKLSQEARRNIIACAAKEDRQ